MPRYITIDENGIIKGDSFLRDEGMEKEYPTLIPIEDDFDLTNKKLDFETETWVEYVPVEPEPEVPQPTQLDRIESMVTKSQEQIAQEARDAYTLELIEGGVIA